MFATAVQNNYLCFGKVALAASKILWEEFWIQINGFWIEIMKKVGQPDHFLIPLDLVRLESAYEVTELPNSIYLETSELTGSIKLYLYTINRFDCIQLYQKIQDGQKLLSTALQKKLQNFGIMASSCC